MCPELKKAWLQKRADNYLQNPKTSKFFTLAQGVNVVEIDVDVPPAEAKSTYKNEKTGEYPVKTTYTLKNGLFLTVPEGLDREIVAKLVNGETKITIVRNGVEKNTRYQVV